MTSLKLQRKYTQLQMLKQQLSAFLEQKQAIDEKTSEITSTITALEKLGTVKKNDEMWSPFGSGVFVNSSVKDPEKVLFEVSAGLVIREKKEKAVAMLEEQRKELENFGKSVMEEAGKYAEHAREAEKDLENLLQEEQEKQKNK